VLKKLESECFIFVSGKTNCVKMNVLPKLLYLFRSLPIFLPKCFFQSTNRLLSSFIWGGKKPRITIRRELLERPKKDGGLALLNLLNYYWAANLQNVVYWFHSSHRLFCKRSKIMQVNNTCCADYNEVTIPTGAILLKPSCNFDSQNIQPV